MKFIFYSVVIILQVCKEDQQYLTYYEWNWQWKTAKQYGSWEEHGDGKMKWYTFFDKWLSASSCFLFMHSMKKYPVGPTYDDRIKYFHSNDLAACIHGSKDKKTYHLVRLYSDSTIIKVLITPLNLLKKFRFHFVDSCQTSKTFLY